LKGYDPFRTCCKGEKTCPECWKLVQTACVILETALNGKIVIIILINYLDDFNFTDILWVFSGSRGIHCWVCDPQAKVLNKEQRSSIMEYLCLINKSKLKPDILKKHMHPFVK